jgi:hypothetical protein
MQTKTLSSAGYGIGLGAAEEIIRFSKGMANGG